MKTLVVKMFSSLTAVRAEKLNRLLYSSGSSFRFVPCAAASPDAAEGPRDGALSVAA